MTEDEAKTKWCPILANIAGKSAQTKSWDNKTVTEVEIEGFKCIASECMAWRVHIHKHCVGGHINNPELNKYEYGEPVGYCGLAGKP
jgi:hypothetical protein